MKLFLVSLGLLALTSCSNPFDSSKHGTIGGIQVDSSQWNAMHAKYKESALFHRRFKHKDVDSLIQVHQKSNLFQIDQIGKSVEGRAIFELAYGKGDKKVMLWSQMHGDEPTATMALFDLFNFLEGKGDGFDSIRTVLQENLNIRFIPMLNPDGAERFLRRNAQSIDLNRDARANQTVEGALLKSRAKSFQPRYGFNLHDQNIYYNVPNTKNPVSISLLAPAYNTERGVNEVREGAMQIIVGMNKILQQYVPDAVAKYDDTYTPRGFGDNFQSWGASTVLIESGGMKGDPEKQEIRKLNFIIILNALIEIAQGSYENYDAKGYEEIPFNASQMHDIVIRGLSFGNDSIPLTSDIAVRRGENTIGGDYFVRGRIEDIGDLPESYGYDEVEAEGLKFIPAKIAPKPLPNFAALTPAIAYDLLKKGYMGVQITQLLPTEEGLLHNLPIQVFSKTVFATTPFIDLGGTANFYIGDSTGKLKYAILNGYLIDLEKPLKEAGLLKNRIQ
ncbi:peptidase M14 [Sphingobacterium sp. DK4209]|uniref:Peptidase M14 n=1 Tax=Sphingobacterium zhuxiongii TaxID=2662364 RepID=A0A5Q0Q8K9_9SPHI|nr:MULTISPECIES: M14 family zinc carboxypeptidase [unclassified Sphingobacterium]MVZ64244.1 peptidase M14 [Sphingobacterium sp. DK4209]QGA25594.1 peptidase M14 [Sphingobacterium sp. dk4302]